MSNIIKASWFQAHKPKTLDDYAFETPELKTTVDKWVEQGYIDGNVLLSGPPGTGKTALSDLLITTLIKSKADLQIIKSRSVSEIDDLYIWCQKKPVKSLKKIIKIEEFDRMSTQAKTQMKNELLETFQEHVTFIVTTNFVNRIEPALVSRFNHNITFRSENVDTISLRLTQILEKEEIQYDKDELKVFVDTNYKSGLRNLITGLQVGVNNGMLDFSAVKTSISSSEEEIISITMDIFKAIFAEPDFNKRSICMYQPMNSCIKAEYTKLIEVIQYSPNLNWDTVFIRLDEQIPFLPVKIIIGKYIERSDYKKIPYIHYLSFIYEAMETIIKINL